MYYCSTVVNYCSPYPVQIIIQSRHLTSLFYSIALDPLYPSQCLWETFGYATGGGFNGEVEGLSPLRLSGQLNTMGCSVTFHQGESVSMVKLIEQVRCPQALVYPISLRVMLHL